MSFLLALAAVLSPLAPAAGKRSASDELAGIAGGDFAAHMLPADTLGVPEPAALVGVPEPAALVSGQGLASERPAGGSGEGADAQQPGPHPDADCLPDPAPGVASEQARAPAAVIIEMPSGEAAADRQTAVVLPEAQLARPAVAAEAADLPDIGRPDAAGADSRAGPERPILPTAPAPLPRAETVPGEAGALHPQQTPEPEAPPTVTGAGGVAPPTAAAAASPMPARQAPPRTLEAAVAGTGRVRPDAAHPAAVRATERSAADPAQEHAAGADSEMARAVEPGRTVVPSARADDQALLQRGSAGPAEQSGPPSPSMAASAGQASGDAQPGRLPLAFGPAAASGVSEVVQAGGRAPVGAAGIEPGRQPAIEQVALQITRAVDQDRTEIRIRLDPPELGEVDIQLEFRDLRLTASVTAERQDTLELLQRDARALARALREAGLDCADADLSFAHDGRNERDAGAYGQRPIGRPQPLPAALLRDLPPELAGPGGLVSLSDGRLDLRV